MLNIDNTEQIKQMSMLTTAVILSVFGITIAASSNTKLCFKGSEVDPPGNITLGCPEGQVISIDEALFGRNKWGACVISDGDCVEKTRIFHECENTNNCTKSFKTYSTTCGYATVMFISYTCLQATYISSTAATIPATTKKTENPAGSSILVTAKTSGLVSRNSGDNINETGLIAGCVVAAVVTVIALVIAITMVVRRLMQKNGPDDENEEDSLQSKSYSCCLCIDRSFCLTTSQSTDHDQHEKTDSSAAASKHSKTQTTVKNGKTNSLTCAAGDVEGNSPYPVSEDDYEKIHLSTQALTGHNTTTNGHMSSEDTDELDSNLNSRMNSINAVEQIYCNDGMENSPKPTSVLNENTNSKKHNQDCTEWKDDSVPESNVSGSTEDSALSQPEDAQEKNINLSPDSMIDNPDVCHSEEQTSRNENDQNQPVKVKKPKYDTLALPNTEQGTAC